MRPNNKINVKIYTNIILSNALITITVLFGFVYSITLLFDEFLAILKLLK
jgi:hypothetical protein